MSTIRSSMPFGARRHLAAAAFSLGTLAALAGLIATASAQDASTSMSNLSISNDKPIQIESDKLDISDNQATAVFTGNVKVVQGETLMKAGMMTVHYIKSEKKDGASGAEAPAQPAAAAGLTGGSSQIRQIDMAQKVFLKSGTQEATADNGTFDMQKRVLVLTGDKVVLSDGDNVLTGCKLTVQLATNEAKLESCNKGRVQIMLDPKSQQKPQQSN